MPIIKSAKKKLRADVKKEIVNRRVKTQAARAIKAVRKSATVETLKQAFSAIDRAAKRNIFHGRKADRLKSRLAKKLVK